MPPPPLDPEVQKSEYQKFRTLYKVFFKADACPSDTIFARNHKEFRKRCKTIEALEKMKSAALFTAAAPKDKKAQVGDLEMSWRGQQPDICGSGATHQVLRWWSFWSGWHRLTRRVKRRP